MQRYLFTSESVTEGHPDKMCDLISDAILDAYVMKDPYARVACEVTTTTGVITVMGEITSSAVVDIVEVVRNTVREIGYVGNTFEFDADSCAVLISLDKQSPDISMGVTNSLEIKAQQNTCSACAKCSEVEEEDQIGAGDQGMMFGYACNETDAYMPAPIYYAHKLCKQLSKVRKDGTLSYLGPDGKSMVTFVYEENVPVRVDTVVVSTQHTDTVSSEQILEDVIENVIKPVIPEKYMDEQTKILVNPTGRFVKGGPCADTGLTGRKIIVDTYGGMGRHGGGAFSGKDCTKVDRTGAYAARYVAKNLVAAGVATRCEVQIAYAIGVAHPISIHVDTYGTSKYTEEKIVDVVQKVFDLRPASMIKQFQMRTPIYHNLAAYGHIGREDLNVAWEKIDKTDEIRQCL